MLLLANILFAAALLGIGWLLITQHQTNQTIMRTLNELESALAGIGDKLDKAKTEITKEIAALREQLGNVALPPSAEAALARLETAAQALDDVIPDAPAEG